MAFNPNKRVRSGFNPNRTVAPLDDTGDLAPPPQPAVSTAVDMGEVPRGKMASLLQAKENVGIPLSPEEFERSGLRDVSPNTINETIEDRERFAEYVKSLPQPDIDTSLRERSQVAQSTKVIEQQFPLERQPATMVSKEGIDPIYPGSLDRRPDEEDLPLGVLGQEPLFKKPPPRGLLGAFARGAGETALRLLAGPSRNQHLPVHGLLSQLEEYNAQQRTDQTFGENIALGAGGLFPYVAAPANQGLLLFLGELAQHPEQIPELIKDVPHRVGLIYKAAIKGDQQAIEQLRQEPVETLLALGIPASIALGLGVKSGSIKSALSKPGRGRIAERAGASLRSEISKTGLIEPPITTGRTFGGRLTKTPTKPPAEVGWPFSPEIAGAVGLSDARRAQAIDLGKLQEVAPPSRQITPPAPLLTGQTLGGRVKAPTVRPEIKPISETKIDALPSKKMEYAEPLFKKIDKWVEKVEESRIGDEHDMLSMALSNIASGNLMRLKDQAGKINNYFQYSPEVYNKVKNYDPPRLIKFLGKVTERFKSTPKPEVPKPVSQTKPKEAVPPTTHPKTAKAVAEGAVSKEPKTIGISNAEVARFRKDFPELSELSRPERISDVKTLSEAKTAGMDRQALSIADDVIRSRRPISRAEEAGIILKQAEIANEIDISTRRIRTLEARGDVKALAIENERRSGFIDQTDRLTRGSEIGGTELARGLGFRRNLVNRESMELAPMLQSAREVAGRKLTDVEVKRYKRISEQYKKKEIELKEMEAKHAEFVAKTEREQAKAIVEREIKARTRVVAKKEKFIAERTDAKKRLAELGFEVKTGINPEALFQIGRIAFSYANERAITFAEVVRKVKADIPALAEADIYKAMLTRDPKLQRKARSEASKRRGSLRTQAKLMVDIGNAEKGILKSPKPRPQQLPEILALRKKLAELKKEMYEHPGGSLMDRREAKALETLEHLQAQLTHYYRNVKKKRPIDSQALTDIKNQSRDFRRLMKIQDEMLDLQEQMKTGVFKIKEQPVVRKRPPALERGEIELQRLRQDYRQAKEDAQPWTVKRGGLEIKNFMQTAKATADMSGVMRQGAILSVADPVLAAKSFKKAFGATFDKYKAEQIALTIESHPLRPLQREAKLFIGEIENINILRSEEVFTSRFAERIPGIGRIVKASERNMVTFLNLLRTGTFNQFVRAHPNATMAELTAWADFVNKASGRGKLTPGTGDLLGILFFAPRFAISRVQTPLTLWKYRKLPRVRNAIAKTMAADVGLGITALTLLELSVDAVDVGVDPRGANFGKARIGNTRIDIWAGFQQPFRLLARGVMKLSDEAGVSGRGLTKAEKDVDFQEAAIQFINYKISPVFSTGFGLIDKRSVVGEETTRLETLAKAIQPIIVESTIEALRDAGPGSAGLTFGLEFLGMGVNTYQDSDTKVRRMFYRAMVTASPAERIRLRVAFEKTIMKKLDTKGRKQRFKYNKETYNKYVRGDTE